MIFVRSNAALSKLATAPKVPNAWMIGTVSRRSISSRPSPAHRRMIKRNQAVMACKTPVPTLADVRDMSLTYQEMENSSLIHLAASGNHGARIEVLKRHIMGVDCVGYEEACKKFDEIAEYNDKGLFFMALPFYMGMTLAVGGAIASFPLVFHEATVHYFNEHFVTADVPDAKDLETWLEVGSWSWNWMEPPLGQISFVLLCLQHARGQMHNLGLKPYTRFLKQKRAERLAKQFPQYDENVVMNYSKSDNFLMGSK